MLSEDEWAELAILIYIVCCSIGLILYLDHGVVS